MKTIRNAFLVTSICLASCASPSGQEAAPEGHAQRQDAIFSGKESGPEQNFVVMVRTREEGTGYNYHASGVLVAPNLVLTALHAVSDFETKDPEDSCAPGEQGPAIYTIRKPSEIEIHPGQKFPALKPPPVPTLKIIPSPAPTACDGDLALVLLDGELEGYPLAQLRLDEPIEPGLQFSSVGWGAINTLGTYPKQRQTRDGLTVLALGPGFYQPPNTAVTYTVPESLFVSSTGPCVGDSGGPALLTGTNVVIGSLSALENPDPSKDSTPGEQTKSCDEAIFFYVRLGLFRQFIIDAARTAGHAPWREGKPKPAAFGASCTEDLDCDRMLCVGGLCSQSCDTQACPEGYECTTASQGKVCTLPQAPMGGGGAAGEGGAAGTAGTAGAAGTAGTAGTAGATDGGGQAGTSGEAGSAGVAGAVGAQPQGGPCSGPSDCASGVCITIQNSNQCSQLCDVVACEGGWECSSIGDQRVCVPPSPAPASDDGCAVGDVGGASGAWWCLLGLLVCRRRRAK